MPEERVAAVIVGAGKVGRGFIAHLLDLAGARITFVEWAPALVEALRRQEAYHIYIAGAPEKDYVMRGYAVVAATDEAQVTAAVAGADLLFTAVGGDRLPSLGPLLAPGIVRRATSTPDRVLNLITCENWTHPGDVLRQALTAALPLEATDFFREHCGVAESTVYRGCIEPTAAQQALDPLAVQGTDYWQLQVDGDHLCQPFPAVPGIVPVTGFQTALERKLFTYSALSAVIAYLGAALGFRGLHEAAVDSRVVAVAQNALSESGAALVRRHGHPMAEQEAHAAESLAAFQDPRNPDTLERHGRDPLRKLGRHDRLVGPAMLCLEEGIQPRSLALAIAAALRYAEASDPSALALQRRLREQPLETVLAQICGIDRQGTLATLIGERLLDLERLIAGQNVV